MPSSFQKQMCTFTVQLLIFVIHLITTLVLQEWPLGFPGDSVLKNPPANAGDTGLIPDPGRSHMPQSNKGQVTRLLSLHPTAHAPQEKPPQ